MGRLANGAALMNDPAFRQWMIVAAATTARAVILEAETVTDHAVRWKLANDAIVQPAIVADRLVTAVATDPAVADAGVLANQNEATLQTKVDNMWTTLAKLMYPA